MGRSIRIRSLLSLTPSRQGHRDHQKGEVHPYLSHFYLRALSRPDGDSTDARDFHIRSKRLYYQHPAFHTVRANLELRVWKRWCEIKTGRQNLPRLFFELAISVCCFCQRDFFYFLSKIASEMKNVGTFNLSRMLLTVYIMFPLCLCICFMFSSFINHAIPLLNAKSPSVTCYENKKK